MADNDSILREFNIRQCNVILKRDSRFPVRQQLRRSKRIPEIEIIKKKNAAFIELKKIIPAKRVKRARSTSAVPSKQPKQVVPSILLKPGKRTNRSKSVTFSSPLVSHGNLNQFESIRILST